MTKINAEKLSKKKGAFQAPSIYPQKGFMP
jgi:hypothetical protein